MTSCWAAWPCECGTVSWEHTSDFNVQRCTCILPGALVWLCPGFGIVLQICLCSRLIGLCREDPSIFGYNLMNEPRSQAELYITQRKTTDGSKIYNISYNPADDLQSWIEDMAAYIKAIDPIHLLSTGSFCPSSHFTSASACLHINCGAVLLKEVHIMKRQCVDSLSRQLVIRR